MSSAERSSSLSNPYANRAADTRRGRSVRRAGRALAAGAVGLGAFAALAGTTSAESAPTVEMVEQWRLTNPAVYEEWLAQSGMTTEEQQAYYQQWRQSQDRVDLLDALMRLWSDVHDLTGFDAERTDIPAQQDVFSALDALSFEELQEVQTVQDILDAVDTSDVEDAQVHPGVQDPEHISPGLREALETEDARDTHDFSSDVKGP